MNCEQVEERLSAYLDTVLAPGEHQALTFHLQHCLRCMLALAELRHNDLLLAQLPRISPSPALRERILAAPGCAGQPLHADERGPAQKRTQRPPRRQRRFPLAKWALAAALVALLGTAALAGLNAHRPAQTSVPEAITPPAAGPGSGQAIPLAAGTRFVFLRDGALWSVLVDGGSHQPERLTPASVTVAAGWQVSPGARGHLAGDLLAYVDQRSARIHTIRSDGQLDAVVPQALLTGSATAANWTSVIGTTILHNLAWSMDGSTLAFVGSPGGDGQTHLYLYSPDTTMVQQIAVGLPGSVAHPVWSPDSARLAFTLAHDGAISVLDYNTQNQEILNLSNLAASQGNSARQILTLGWSPVAAPPAVTWSLGSIGRINSLWLHRIGAAGTLSPQLLLSGTYLQALYSPQGVQGAGSWLVVTTVAGQAGDIWRVNLTPGAPSLPLSQGKQVSLVRWSPDGATIFYLDGQNNGSGHGHLLNPTTGADWLLPDAVAANPAPAWSEDGQHLAASAGHILTIVNATDGSLLAHLQLPGRITNLCWVPADPHQLVTALDSPPGLYLVDMQRSTPVRLGQAGADAPVQWSEIP